VEKKMAHEPASTKYEIELSPEMATLLRGMGIPQSTRINGPEDLALFSRIGSLAQQFGATTSVATKGGDGPVTNQMWCSLSARV
jgi:hypothetical protein